MQKKEKKTVSYTTEVVLCRICDLCGKESERPDSWDGSWANEVHERDSTQVQVIVQRNKGVSYPEDNHGVVRSVDICPDCFEKKLIPWLKSQGADITEEPYDY